jgi:hypothetical protein
MTLPARSAALALAALLALPSAVASAATAPPAPTAPPSSGGDTARVRVGHFAAGLGEVTVQLEGGPLVEGLAYGEVSDYQTVAPGEVTVTYRTAGAAPEAAPLATTEVAVDAGQAGSAVMAGAGETVQAKGFVDDLTAPPSGTARIRLVHLAPSVPAVDARVRDGVRLFADAVFGEATSYRDVPAGAYDLEMLRAGTEQVLLAVRGVTVSAGSVYTMVGTGGGAQPVEVRGFVDAAGAGTAPTGGVAAGSGGAAPAGQEPGLGVPVLAGVLALVAAAGTRGLRRRPVAAPQRGTAATPR